MRPKPYIGITGFRTQQEVESVLGVLPANSDRLVMIGVLASGKTIRGIPNKWPKRYPKVDDLWSIFNGNPNVLKRRRLCIDFNHWCVSSRTSV